VQQGHLNLFEKNSVNKKIKNIRYAADEYLNMQLAAEGWPVTNKTYCHLNLPTLKFPFGKPARFTQIAISK
jgi:hypothetical protein